MASDSRKNAPRWRIRDRHRRWPSTVVGALAVGLWLPAAFAQGGAVDLSRSEEPAPSVGSDAIVESSELFHFGFGAITLDAAALQPLDSIVERVVQDDALRIRIAAHTDNRGWSLGNIELSRLRALAVARHLLAQGVDVERISARAYGESMPLVPNATAEGRRKNRRVRISLLR